MKRIESVGSVCIDKSRYDAVISRLPLASHAFDVALKSNPPQEHHLNKGLLTLRIDDPGDRACETQLQVNGYSLGVFDLSPILCDVLVSGAIEHELRMLSGYDVVVDDSYPSFIEPVRHAKKTFTKEEIQRINDEEKQRALLRQPSKQIIGYNPDMRDMRLKSGVMTVEELTNNPYGSAIPTFRFVDPRYAMLLLTSDKIGLSSLIDEERIGALNLVAQLLMDKSREIQMAVAFDDEFKEHLKIVGQIKNVLQLLLQDDNTRLSLNAQTLDTFASRIIDEGVKVFQTLKNLAKENEPEAN